MKTVPTKKYSNWFHLGFYGGLQRATVVLFGMLSTMVLAHKAIEPADMGVWSLFLIIGAFVEIMRHGLVKNSVIKYLNSHKEEDKVEILSSALVLNIVITGLIGLLLLALTPTIVAYTKAPKLESMIYWYMLALVALIPFSQFEWLMLARLHFKQLFWTYVVRQSIILLLLVGAVVLKITVTLNMLVVFYAIGVFLGAVSGYIFNRSIVSLQFKFSPDWIKRLWHFGKYVFGTGVSNLIFRSTDSFMVSNITASTALVADQGIALRIFNLIDIPSQLIGDILFPKSSAVSADNKERIRHYYEKSTGATLSIILPAILFVLLFPKIPVLIIAGPKYLGTIPYLRILMFVSIFLAFLKQFGTIADSVGKPQMNFVMTTFIALINLFFCYVFIKRFGLIGAAYGLLSTHVVAFIITQSFLFKNYQVRFLHSFKYAFQFYPEIGKMLYTKIFKR